MTTLAQNPKSGIRNPKSEEPTASARLLEHHRQSGLPWAQYTTQRIGELEAENARLRERLLAALTTLRERC